jgi:HD-GYP domain-containing protein (c-di-GMP phosphodiesterase class II)
LSSADQQRLAQIADFYRWQDAQGVWRSAVTSDELENLAVHRGTLTPAEVQVINSHVTTTLRMLEALPLPLALRQMPQIAASHHERIDGRGYPRGLAAEKLPMQARILAIADIFEALTACDRPYKPGRTVNEALEIMQGMVRSGHIDGDLLELFVREGVHVRYAREHLKVEPASDPPMQSRAIGNPAGC